MEKKITVTGWIMPSVRPAYYMLVNKNHNPISINGQLPIYWYRKTAKEDAVKYGAHAIVKVFLDND